MKYVPILRGKAGELTALGEISAQVRAAIRPVLEVVPDDRLKDVVQTFATHAGNLLPKDLAVTVDCGPLWSLGRVGTGFDGHALGWISRYLEAFGQPVIPAIRATDADGPLNEARQVQIEHGHGACLRISLDELPGSPEELTRLAAHALDVIALRPERVDLLIDAGYLRDEHHVAKASAIAANLLTWAAHQPWRSVALGGGAFPSSLRGIAPQVLTPLPRREVDLWLRTTTRIRTAPPDFADHGVTHPKPPGRGYGRAAANLRYTSGPSWQVIRARRGDNTISLCRQLTPIADWSADVAHLSWGDRQLRSRATGAEHRPGGPMNWRSWETSHHLATVAESIGLSP